MASNNISAIINAIVGAGEIPVRDIIDKVIGLTPFLYYTIVDKLHIRPRDMTEFVDCLLYIDGISYIQKQEMDRLKRQAEVGNNGKSR